MKKVLIVGWAVLFAGCAPEPTFEGKRLSHWRQELNSPITGERWRAALALGAIGPPAKGAVPEIAKLLQDPDQVVRYQAAQALGSFGPDAKPAVPALREAVRRGDRRFREMARTVLLRIDPDEAREEEK
jgi:HEAT repeat protein